MRILAADGAMANVGLALVDTSLCPARRDPRDSLRLAQAAHGLVATARWRTAPGEASVLRSRSLAAWYREQLRALAPDVVIFEVPGKDGAYARVQQRQRGKAQLNARGEALMNRGIGALAGAVPAEVLLLELAADRQHKESRKGLVNLALLQAGRAPIQNEHEADAAYYALSWAGASLADPAVFESHAEDGVLYPQARLRGVG